jgi:hypothetical protein
MSPQDPHVPASERLARLERKAKVIRSRLLRTVDALDARRHQVVEVGHQAKAMVRPVAISLVGIAVLFGATVFAFSLALRARRRVSFSHRMSDRASHALQGLDRARRPSLPRRILEKVTFSVVSFAATELLKRATKNLVDGRLLDGRIAVRDALEEHHNRLALPHGAGQ